MRFLRLVLVSTAFALTHPCAWGAEPAMAVGKLQRWDTTQGRASLQRIVDEIRTAVQRGDARIAGQLIKIVRDEAVPNVVKMEALRLACEKADPVTAAFLVSLANGWAHDLDGRTLTPEEKRDDLVATKIFLLHTFVSNGVGWVHTLLDDQRALLDVLKFTASHTLCSLETKNRCYKAIAECSAPVGLRRDYALAAIEDLPNRNVAFKPLLALVNSPEARARLREMVRRTEDPSSFHYTAAATLAHLGDREILPDLQRLKPVFDKRGPNVGGILAGYTWKIEIQRSSDMLLSYIASPTAFPPTVEPRLWALRRAVELKIPSERIRRAILDYAATVEPGARGFGLGVPSLKSVGVKLGVLTSNDLPNVPSYPDLER